MPLNDEQKAALTAILADAEPGDFPGYVSQATLTSRLKGKDTKHQGEAATAAAVLADLQTKHDADQAELKTFRDKDSTADQIRDRDLIDAEKRFDAQKTLTEAEKKRGDALYTKAQVTFVRDSVAEMIAASGVVAAKLPTAIREAMAENQFSVVDSDGAFSLQMTANGLPVDKPADAFGQWWKQRTDLHVKGGTEMTSPGAGRPPGEPLPKKPLEGLAPGAPQITAAFFGPSG